MSLRSTTSRRALARAAGAAAALLLASCGDAPLQPERLAPRSVPVLTTQSVSAPGCTSATPAERLQRLQRGVARLPEAASAAAEERLVPGLRAAEAALGRGQGRAAVQFLEGFIEEVEELRLRAMFEDRVALVREAQCLLGGIDASAE